MPDILKGWNIVVIDDESDSLMVAEILLQEYGAAVHTAANGAEGLERTREVRPRLIISDLSMPEVDGWAFIHTLRQEPSPLRDIPVVALTAHAMVGDRERAMAAGFHNYLTKPLTADTFMSNLLALLTDIPEFHDLFGKV